MPDRKITDTAKEIMAANTAAISHVAPIRAIMMVNRANNPRRIRVYLIQRLRIPQVYVLVLARVKA